ncbi:MAG TPA: 1-deoxy-D-xylulose-5-phosphate synthase [Rhodothermales bacterium]|nr:1-deoxy-D-xylulose-5-phosphate synthase [Rhodothermales bacterium]
MNEPQITHTPGPLLTQIDFPHILRALPVEKLPQVAEELREYIIDIISVHGGHFAASLGVVELTVALHYVYRTPKDQIVWDVGHQAYGHKILTGRRDVFHTNRKYQGISGFPKRSESEYDTFGVGHASTSISAALGMAKARDITETDQKVVAIIGDGSMTGGLAFEGLNNAGTAKSDLLVILNDNRMSIDPNVGALNEYLAEITAGKGWNTLRDEVWDFLERMKGKGGGTMQRFIGRIENGMKAALTPGGLFEALGFRYFGPVDGHDVVQLAKILDDLKDLKGPILLHCMTVKGKGFAPAEQDQLKWHAQSSPFDKLTGESLVKPDPGKRKIPNWQDVFGDAILELAKQDPKIVGITAAMPSGTGLSKMMKQMPHRAFDVGIAEMHAVVEAAGMATQGLKPFVAIYSSFLQRAYDGIIHDVALQDLPVVFCMDRSGLVGADGATHHGALDIPYLRCVQNMVVAAPMEAQDLRNLMFSASLHAKGPYAIRYPRGGTSDEGIGPFVEIPIGTGRKVTGGADVAILSYGAIGQSVSIARKHLQEAGIDAAHYDLRFVKPLDQALLEEVFTMFDVVVTIEDGVIQGGAGSAVLEWMSDHGYKADVLRLGLPDTFVEHGTQNELYAEAGLDPQGIARQTLAFIRQHQSMNA